MSNISDPPRYSSPLAFDPAATISEPWFSWFRELATDMNSGVSATITLAKLTGGGTEGSLTFRNGRLISYVDPT